MIAKLLKIAAVTGLFFGGQAAFADTWTLDAGNSKLAFGSIKKGKVGEVHSFENLSGIVSPEGAVSILIDLSSVETNIDIRNERMVEHVFKGLKEATLNAQMDMAELNALPVGGTSVIDVEGSLSLIGTAIDIEAEMFIARISNTQVLVTTNDMIFLSTEDAGLTAGIDKLMELAKLPSIARSAPVTLRFMFTMDEKKAEAASAAPATAEMAFAGNAKAGKKVFKKCKACHQVKAGKNGVGPSLHNIIGAKAATVEGYNYSKAMEISGLTWDAETLTAFLTKPKAVVKGTKMAFNGLKKEKDIENLLAYLAEN